MTRDTSDDPNDAGQREGGGRFVPVAGAYGTEVVLPGPLTAGRPKPEPEERWTLAPRRTSEDDAGNADQPVAAPAEPDDGPAAGPGEGPSEPDRA